MLLNCGVGKDFWEFLGLQPIHPKGDQSWIFTGRTDAEAETLILWSPDAKNWLVGKDPDTGKDWRREEKGTTEDEMVGWHYWRNGHWVWVGSGSWWWTGRPRVLRFMESQRVGHDWAAELNWIRASKALHAPLLLFLTFCPTTLPLWSSCYFWNIWADFPSRTLLLLCPLPQKFCPQIFTIASSFPILMCQLKAHVLREVFLNYPISFTPCPFTP